MEKCPNGHASTAADFCSDCGIEMPQAASQAASAAASNAPVAVKGGAVEHCPKCTSERDDLSSAFCGVCGYNFQTGQGGEAVTPEPVAVTTAPAPTPAPAAVASQAGPRLDIVVTVDESKANSPKGCPPLTFSLFDDESLIGRKSASAQQTVPVDRDEALSRRHCMIVRLADGSYVVRDTNSANGTYLNGKELTAGADYALKEGDKITLGEWTVITVQSIRQS